MTALFRIKGLAAAVRIPGRAPRRLLNGVDLELAPASVSLFLGASGSGKTTLLHALMNEPHSNGTLFLEQGTLPIARAGEAVLLPQDPAATMDPRQSTFSLVREVLPPKAPRDAEALLRAFDVPEEFWQACAGELSVGLAQRVQLAAVVGMEPAWLLLDEPTSALDRLRALRVASELKSLAARGTGVLVATHDLFFARALGGCAHFLSEGAVVETSQMDTLLREQAHPATAAFVAAGFPGERP